MSETYCHIDCEKQLGTIYISNIKNCTMVAPVLCEFTV